MEATGKRGRRLSCYVDHYVVFDLETTGVSTSQDDIIEVSAVKVRDHRICESCSTLVNPGRPIPAQATSVNKITDAMVESAPRLEDVFPDFMAFVGHEILVGHNIHCFDMQFLYNASVRIFDRELPNDYIDTLYMARACLPQLAHHRLCDVSQYFKISTKGAHRALNDCVMNQQCYERLGALMEEENVPVCPRCGGELLKRSGKFGAFYGCSNFPTCRYTKNC